MATPIFLIGTADDGNTPNTTGSFTPTAGSLMFVFVFGSGTVENPATITNSNGITFTQIGSFTNVNSGGGALYMFVANATSNAASQTITFQPVDTATATMIFVYEVTGMSKVGSAAVRQSATNAENVGADTTPDATFASSCLTDNVTLGCAIVVTTTPAALTPPTNWTEPAGGDIGTTAPAFGGEVCHRASGFTGTLMEWGTSATNWGVAIVELDTSPSQLNTPRARFYEMLRAA